MLLYRSIPSKILNGPRGQVTPCLRDILNLYATKINNLNLIPHKVKQ